MLCVSVPLSDPTVNKVVKWPQKAVCLLSGGQRAPWAGCHISQTSVIKEELLIVLHRFAEVGSLTSGTPPPGHV